MHTAEGRVQDISESYIYGKTQSFQYFPDNYAFDGDGTSVIPQQSVIIANDMDMWGPPPTPSAARVRVQLIGHL